MKKSKDKKERKKWTIRKRIIFLVMIVLVVLVTVIMILLWRRKKGSDAVQNNMPSMNNGVVTATGTTVTDSFIEELDIDSLETSLYVEDIYASSGQSVKSGDKILKITDESMEKAQKELEQKAKKAQIAYQQQLVTFEQNKIEAKRDADIDVISAKYADQDYAYNLKQASDKLEDLQKQVSDAKDLVDEYTNATESNYYYTYYNVKELQDEAYENFALLIKLYDEWNISSSSSQTIGQSTTNTGSNTGGPSGAMGGGSEASQKSSIYSDFDEEVTEEIKERDEAIDNYESALKKAKYSLEDAKAQYEILNAELVDEQVSFEKEKITLKTTCDTAKAEAEIAENSYETQLKKLQEELDTVEEENDDAQDNLNTFLAGFKDGYLVASADGTIMMIDAKREKALDLSRPLVAYMDTQSVTISVAVEQTDISKIEVGSKAVAVIDELGNYDGIVTSINPISSSDSRSSVSYEVIITLTGDLTGLESNLTATVMIGDSDLSDMNTQDSNQIKGDQNEGKDFENSNNVTRPDVQAPGNNPNVEFKGKIEE